MFVNLRQIYENVVIDPVNTAAYSDKSFHIEEQVLV